MSIGLIYVFSLIYLQEQDRREAEIRQRREERDRREREQLEEIEREKREREEEIEKQKREEREWRERRERERKERDDRERREREEEERKRKREEEEEERKWKEERDRRKREAEEMFSKQKRDKEERERREREAQDRKEREERERREVERQAQEERERLEFDQAEQDRRRQKDLLLAKMKAIDDGPAKAEKDTELFSLSQNKTATKSKTGSDVIFGSPKSTKKEYNFSRPIENMHSGKPAYKSTSSKRKPLSLFDSDDSDGGGYNPSFGESKRNTKPVKKDSFFDDSPTSSAGPTKNAGKKSNLMTSLFGDSASSKPSSTTDTTTKGLDFTFNSSPKKTGPAPKKENSSTQIYGGGSSFIEGEDQSSAGKGSGLLPRRVKQPSTTIHNRPTVNAIDSFEDEIEEVIL